MIGEHRPGSTWSVLLVLAAGCVSGARAVGTIADGASDEASADAGPHDLVIPEGPRYEHGPIPEPCGNGRLDPGEQCDDGNYVDGDGCDSVCQIECPRTDPSCALCGDGVRGGGEACDDGNTIGGDGCASDCHSVEPGWRCLAPAARCFPICGDGVITPPETCDDGNQQSGDGCSSTCVLESPCAAADGSPSACPATCGNGRIDGAEECDDGPNNADLAGDCSTACRRLYCGDGIATPPETCDFGPNGVPIDYAAAPAQGCSSSCSTPRFCGDGVTDTAYGEQCDLGSENGQPIPEGARTCVVCDSNCMLTTDCS